MRDQTPGMLGPYRLLQRLGEGGMGVVYLAIDPRQRRVAVKALRPAVAADPNARRRLAREVETMRRVRSPFVAEVMDADVTSDPPYIVTRYVSGRTLEEVVGESGPLYGQHLARVASGLALALAAVHAAGVVHRDLKPGNVMLAGGEPVVIDFGIAQVPDATRLTQTGMFMGTPGYLAPEVIEGKPSGPASDVHSWGATVAFAATGRPPFGTGAFETIFYRIINGQPDLDGFPAPLLAVVRQSLSRDPARRPDTAELCHRTAVLDPASLLPAPAAAATAPPRAAPATAGERGRAAALHGAAGGGVAAAWPPSARPWGADTMDAAGSSAGAAGGRAAGAVMNGGGAGAELARPGGAAGNFGDVLPPVQYAPSRGVSPTSGQPVNGPAARGTSSSAAGPLLVAASVAAAICVSIVFPVAGTILALAALVGMRAADRTMGRLTRRRSRRGAGPGDVLLAAVTFPPALAWSAIRALLLAPLALVVALAAVAVTLIAVPHDPIAVACAYGAGALVAFYGFGPGSGSSRRPVRSLFDNVAGTPLSAAIAFAAMAVIVIGALAVTASHAPSFWPISNLAGWLGHFHVVQVVVHGTRNHVLRLIGRQAG